MNYREKFPILFNDFPSNAICADTVCEQYEALRAAAPKRKKVKKCYFVKGHNGIPSTTGKSNRHEEHLAIALFNLRHDLPYATGKSLRILDYQFPLQSARADIGIGKIDLLGITNQNRVAVIELKVGDNDNHSLLKVLLQGLRYAAIVEANHCDIANELKHKQISVANQPPVLQLLAPAIWWNEAGLRNNDRAEFVQLARKIESNLGVTVECVEILYGDVIPGCNGTPSILTEPPKLQLMQF